MRLHEKTAIKDAITKAIHSPHLNDYVGAEGYEINYNEVTEDQPFVTVKGFSYIKAKFEMTDGETKIEFEMRCHKDLDDMPTTPDADESPNVFKERLTLRDKAGDPINIDTKVQEVIDAIADKGDSWKHDKADLSSVQFKKPIISEDKMSYVGYEDHTPVLGAHSLATKVDPMDATGYTYSTLRQMSGMDPVKEEEAPLDDDYFDGINKGKTSTEEALPPTEPTEDLYNKVKELHRDILEIEKDRLRAKIGFIKNHQIRESMEIDTILKRLESILGLDDETL